MSISILTLEEAEQLAQELYFEPLTSFNYRCIRKAVKTESGLRDALPNEAIGHIVDTKQRTCTCGEVACDHLKLAMFASALHLLD